MRNNFETVLLKRRPKTITNNSSKSKTLVALVIIVTSFGAPTLSGVIYNNFFNIVYASFIGKDDKVQTD